MVINYCPMLFENSVLVHFNENFVFCSAAVQALSMKVRLRLHARYINTTMGYLFIYILGFYLYIFFALVEFVIR